ncbi:MAG: twin-arginine translocase TatA/TatE family subunit [Desulfobulbaceae bacterium]|jgi:sec-independent protein translocase protein TatA|nr:twin-arginine translocase TatA/TatE family subunit [Desulfobulbaceae bacterium]MDY0351383.1 twin-arginine translocase TatA/TatE family subunit [Desulfobulbaceae bacterium]
MFGLGTPELLIILTIAFLVFGGKKLPELGAGLGKGITSFKKGLRGDAQQNDDKPEITR